MPIKSSSFVYAPVAPPGSTEKEWKQCFCGSLWRWASAWFEEFPLQGPQLLMIQEAALEIFCNTLEYMNQQKVMNKVPIEFFMFFHAQYKKKTFDNKAKAHMIWYKWNQRSRSSPICQGEKSVSHMLEPPESRTIAFCMSAGATEARDSSL